MRTVVETILQALGQYENFGTKNLFLKITKKKISKKKSHFLSPKSNKICRIVFADLIFKK